MTKEILYGSTDEVKKYKFAIKQINEKNGKESTVDLHNHREIWEYFVNDRLLNVLKNLLGQNVYYLHNCSTLHQDNVTVKQSWHRDNACRIVGKGPDWDNNLPYNVLTVITYLSSFEETKSTTPSDILNKGTLPLIKSLPVPVDAIGLKGTLSSSSSKRIMFLCP